MPIIEETEGSRLKSVKSVFRNPLVGNRFSPKHERTGAGIGYDVTNGSRDGKGCKAGR